MGYKAPASIEPAIAAVIAFLLTASGLALAGPPFMTDDPVPVDYGHWEVYAFSAGARGSSDTSGLGPSMEVNYGALPNLQLHIAAGFAFDDFSGGNLPRRHLQMGLGDTELGAKYRFITPDDDDWWPQVATFPAVELPSGNAGRGLGAGQTQAFLPVWAQKDFGKWTTYGGGGYWINPGPGNKDYWFAGWLIQRQITDDFALGVEVFHQTAAMIGSKASSGFNAGGIYDLTEHDHLLFSAGQGGLQYAVNGAAAQNPFTYYLGFQWTF